jgi:hypothetical protein
LSSLGDGETLDSFCGLIGILIMDSEISACWFRNWVDDEFYLWRSRGFWSM